MEEVISHNVLDHSFDPAKSLGELKRVLSDKGRLIFMINVVHQTLQPLAPALRFVAPPHPHVLRAEMLRVCWAGWVEVLEQALRKGAKDKPRLAQLLCPSHWKYCFVHYAMSVVYVVTKRQDRQCRSAQTPCLLFTDKTRSMGVAPSVSEARASRYGRHLPHTVVAVWGTPVA